MSQKDTIILGIESSCDDTSAAVLQNERILSNVIASQDIHKLYGGVVPELASRAHQQNIIPVVDQAIKKAGITLDQIDAIAFTKGPGLLGSLVVGTSFSKAFSLALDIPMIDVNHMHGHVLAHFIDDEGKDKPSFPFLCLTVSGGHTQIVLVKAPLEMEVILGFQYPGGPLIDKYSKEGNPLKFEFAKPKMEGYDFSFSGLKTSILYFLQKQIKLNSNFVEENLADICASIQKSIIDILFVKLTKAANDLNINQIALAGGVSANSGLRNELIRIGGVKKWKTFIPKFEFCTDNAAMIAITGKYMFENELFAEHSVSAMARMKM